MTEQKTAHTHYFDQTGQSLDESRYIHYKSRCRGLTIQRDGYRGLFNNGDIDEGTKFLLEHIELRIQNLESKIQNSTSLLDLGCGSGIIPLWIMAYAEQKKITSLPRIDACDISPLAISCSQHNTEKYKNITVIPSDILANAYFDDKKYDLILTNPPFAAGKKTVREFFRQGYDHLTPGGQMRCVAPTNKGAKSHIVYCETIGSVTIVAVEKGWRVWYIQK